MKTSFGESYIKKGIASEEITLNDQVGASPTPPTNPVGYVNRVNVNEKINLHLQIITQRICNRGENTNLTKTANQHKIAASQIKSSTTNGQPKPDADNKKQPP